MDNTRTRERILSEGERLIKTLGYNGFSFGDISESLNITKAAIHYHFKTKVHLVSEIVQSFSKRFEESLLEIKTKMRSPGQALKAYIDLFTQVMIKNEELEQSQVCVCGVLLAEINSLPNAVKDTVNSFTELNKRWISSWVEKDDRINNSWGTVLFSTLEGMMLTHRVNGGFDETANELVELMNL